MRWKYGRQRTVVPETGKNVRGGSRDYGIDVGEACQHVFYCTMTESRVVIVQGIAEKPVAVSVKPIHQFFSQESLITRGFKMFGFFNIQLGLRSTISVVTEIRERGDIYRGI